MTGLCLMCSSALFGYAQNTPVDVVVTVLDKASQEGLPYATVVLKRGADKAIVVSTNNLGVGMLRSVPEGDYTLTVSYIGLDTHTQVVRVTPQPDGKALAITVSLQNISVNLSEVVVTATESKGLTSSSVIHKQAMIHLQPSSIMDIMALVPGNSTSDPAMGRMNLFTLREAGGGSSRTSEYGTSYLGTQFMVDGIPISGDADLQGMMDGAVNSNNPKNIIGVGIDLRKLSTDDIESVEVVRGIPSVEYGDLTTGMVKIQRKRGSNDLETRVKADVTSKLFYVGKGFQLPRDWGVNVSGDFLQSFTKPTDTYTTFNRASVSVRAYKRLITDNYIFSCSISADYRGTMDNMKTDPDKEANSTDYYKSDKNGITMSNFLEMRFKESFLQSVSLTTSFSYDKDLVTQQRSIFARGLSSKFDEFESPMQTGESVMTWLPAQYTAVGKVDGKPLNIYMKLMGTAVQHKGHILNTIKMGADWRYNKNLGKGYISDLHNPLFLGSSRRSMAFDEIPGMHQTAFFLEDIFQADMGRNRLEFSAGVRGMTMFNLKNIHSDAYTHYSGDPSDAHLYHYGDTEASFDMSGMFYFDPRVNLRWTFPTAKIFGKDFSAALSGGVGRATKMPAMTHIYQDLVWMTQAQLMFTPVNSDANLIYSLTRTADPTNYAIKPASNLKYEVSADLEFADNRLSVTGFVEDMKNGFRSQRLYIAFPYNYYISESYRYNDPSLPPAGSLTTPPSLDAFYHTKDTVFYSISNWLNASRTYKKGIEFVFSSKRIESIHTRLTITGAWLYTRYAPSEPMNDRTSTQLNHQLLTPGYTSPYVNVPRYSRYYGIYENNQGRKYESLNTNFIIDTDIPVLKMGFSLTFECEWYNTDQSTYGDSQPTWYVDYQGNVHPFMENYTTATGIEKSWLDLLDRRYTDASYLVGHMPFEGFLNFKATKRFWGDRMTLAIFVNRLAAYLSDYTLNGTKITRAYTSTPYFGMELNCKF